MKLTTLAALACAGLLTSTLPASAQTRSSTYGYGYETHRYGNKSVTHGRGYSTYRKGGRSVTYFPGGRTERFNTPCGPASVTYTANGVTRRGGC